MELAIGTKIEAIKHLGVFDIEDDSKNYDIKKGRQGVITDIDENEDFNFRKCYILDFNGDDAYVVVEKFDTMFKVI